MKEIGGYIELDSYSGNMLHEEAVKLNCAKNCLAYLIIKKSIKKIHIPYFLCDSIFDICRQYGVEIVMYHIDENLMPVIIEEIEDSDWLYLVNYYGQLPGEIVNAYRNKYNHLILDNVQDYYAKPIEGVDTFYSCRKFFGVADGAVLYSDVIFDEDIPLDESYSRMGYILGRYEKDANLFYQDYINNNKNIREAPIKKMSRLTENLLHGVDYDKVAKIRTQNFVYLDNRLKKYNRLRLRETVAPFAYPFYHENGAELRRRLISNKIYVPILWPNVLNFKSNFQESNMAENILPLPCDQRYTEEAMEYIVKNIIGDC